MFVSNKKEGSLVQLRVRGVEPFPLVLNQGCYQEVDDSCMTILAPYAEQFGLHITKNAPKGLVEQGDYEAPVEETTEGPVVGELNEPAPKAEVEAKAEKLNEPAPKAKAEARKKLNEGS